MSVELEPQSASFQLSDNPRLRAVEVLPIHDREQRALVLRDPADATLTPILVSDGAAEVLALLDGQRTISELATTLLLRGRAISELQLRTFLTRLDEAGFLEGPRWHDRFERRRAQFLLASIRPAVHAAGAYAASPDELRQMLEAGYLHPDGPGSLPTERRVKAPPVTGLIAPHIDLHRGAPTYSWAYSALSDAQPSDVYVVLGTCHTPLQGHFAATTKAYATPLGDVPADGDFLERLALHYGADLYAGEFSHASEHSIEFQAVYLRALGLAGQGGATIAPILCDSLHNLVPFGTSPRDVPVVAEFLGALRHAMIEDGRTISLVAAVDLAHIGPRFGDSWPVDFAQQARVAQADRETLALALAPDAEAYYAHVMRDRDARRICGLTPIYLLSALMEAERRPGQLLRYTQWVDSDQSSSVTFASAVFR